MTWTVPKLELNIQNSLHGADNWVDVTADVRGSISIQSGRQSELDRYSASTCSFTLDNRTRKYDFTYAAGPYYGLLIPRMEVRITATFLSTTYSLFFGRVQGWPLSYENMTQTSDVTLNAVDGFDIWAQKRWNGHPYATYLQNLGPYMWFRMVAEGDKGVVGGDPAESHVAYDAFGRHQMIFTEGAFSNEGTGGPTQADAKAENQGRVARFENSGWSRVYTRPLPVSPTVFAVGLWFRALPKSYHSAGGSNDAGIFSLGQSLRVAIAWDAVTSAGKLKVTRTDVGGAFTTSNTFSEVADGKWHWLMIVNESGGTRFYLDGVNLGLSTTFLGKNYDDVATVILGRNMDTATSQPLNGWIHDFFTMQFAPSASVVASLYAAATNWQDQTTSQRVQSILEVFVQDLITQDFDNGLMRIAPVKKVLDGNMLETMQQASDVEAGYLFIKPDGSLAFRRKNTPLTATRSTTTQATFGDTGTDIRYLEATPTLDMAFMYNEVIASREEGGTYVSRDLNSQDAYEVRSRDNGELPYVNDNDVIAQAQWIVDLYGMPTARLPYVKFSARYSNAAMTYALDSRLLDRIIIKRSPVGGGAQWSFTTHIESKNTTINLSSMEWNVVFTLTQNSIVSGYMVLDGATVDSQLNAGFIGV